jgi:hypothetical protein
MPINKLGSGEITFAPYKADSLIPLTLRSTASLAGGRFACRPCRPRHRRKPRPKNQSSFQGKVPQPRCGILTQRYLLSTHLRNHFPKAAKSSGNRLDLNIPMRPTMGFGHVDIFRRCVSRLLLVPHAGNAEVRVVTLSHGKGGVPCVKNLLLTASSL